MILYIAPPRRYVSPLRKEREHWGLWGPRRTVLRAYLQGQAGRGQLALVCLEAPSSHPAHLLVLAALIVIV